MTAQGEHEEEERGGEQVGRRADGEKKEGRGEEREEERR